MCTYNNKKILVVEDDLLWQELLGAMLCERGYNVETTSDVYQAIDYLTKKPSSVGLVLSDVNMPGKSGLDLVSFIKKSSLLKDIPIILQSGESCNTLQKGLDMGATKYIQKPYRKEKLFLTLNEVQWL